MNNLTKILVFISLFTMAVMFTGTVSASNCTVNPENHIMSPINNASSYNKVIVNDINKTTHTNTKNISINKKAVIKPISSNISSQTENPSNHNITNNSSENISHLDTKGIIMATTDYNCGPAALATVMQNYFGINTTQDQLAALAGTNKNGTTMYGLAQAAKQQGMIAKGLKLTASELKSGNIIYLTMNGKGHYSIITNITNTTVYLADPNSGNIKMTLTDFTEAYVQDTLNECGYAVIITNETNDPQLNNNNTLTDDELQNIKGLWIGKLVQLVYKYGKPVIDGIGHVLTVQAIWDSRDHIWRNYVMWVPTKQIVHTKYGITLK